MTWVLFTHAGWRETVEFMHHCSLLSGNRQPATGNRHLRSFASLGEGI